MPCAATCRDSLHLFTLGAVGHIGWAAHSTHTHTYRLGVELRLAVLLYHPLRLLPHIGRRVLGEDEH